MGCTGSVNVDLKDLPLFEGFREICDDYNGFCARSKRITERFNQISMNIDTAIFEFFPNARMSQDFGMCVIEGYLVYVLSVYHLLYKTKQVNHPISFSNYLPGIILDFSHLESTSNENEDLIKRKYEVLKAISQNLPIFIEDFDRLCKDLINIVSELRDNYPLKLYQRSLELPGITCIVSFSQIESILLHNIEAISKPALEFEKIFKSIRVYIRKVKEVIEKCNQRFSDFKKILDGVDNWDYSSRNEIVERRLAKFLRELNFTSST